MELLAGFNHWAKDILHESYPTVSLWTGKIIANIVQENKNKNKT